MQSRGLSPKDKTPWLTLIITGLSCIGLGKAFLVLQANYETEGASWAAAGAGVKLDSGGAASGGVRRAGGGSVSAAGGLGAADATLSSDAGAGNGGNALGSAAAEALRAAEPPPAREGRGAASGGAAVAGSSPLDGLDATCGGELNLDLDGPAVSWGLDYKTVRAQPACARVRSHAEPPCPVQATAAECCDACKKHTKKQDQPGDCNSWVWCPEPLWCAHPKACVLCISADDASPRCCAAGARTSGTTRTRSVG